MPKSVSIYQRKGALYVSAAHKTQAGFWIDEADVVMLPNPEPANVESVVKAALVRSREGVPTPPQSADLSASLLAAAGVASWNTFAKSAKYVDVHQDGDSLKVTPYRNLGGRDGFEPMQDRAAIVAVADPRLGEAVIRALEAAEEKAR